MTARTAATTPTYSCPKCHGTMRSYERTGIVIEQCEDCRGIFLDRGELERFVEAEGGGWSGRVGAPRAEWQPESGEPEDAERSRDARPASDGEDGDDDTPPDAAEARRREQQLSALMGLFGEIE